jgi:hypothetical protein
LFVRVYRFVARATPHSGCESRTTHLDSGVPRIAIAAHIRALWRWLSDEHENYATYATSSERDRVVSRGLRQLWWFALVSFAALLALHLGARVSARAHCAASALLVACSAVMVVRLLRLEMHLLLALPQLLAPCVLAHYLAYCIVVGAPCATCQTIAGYLGPAAT